MRIVAAFPGTGKSEAAGRLRDLGIAATVLDSSEFSKAENFPQNYIAAISNATEKGAGICYVSTDKVFLQALVDAELPFSLVYPHSEHKDMYIERYKSRNDSDAFIKLMEDNFDNFVSDCRDMVVSNVCIRGVICSGYISEIEHINGTDLKPKYLTKLGLEDKIKSVHYHRFPNTTATVCCILLRNGASIIGESHCLNEENFNAERGNECAYEDAFRRALDLEGYALRTNI